jgi:hypothetical protein
MTRFNVHTQNLVTGVVRRLGARTYSGLKIQTLSWQYRPIAQKDGYMGPDRPSRSACMIPLAPVTAVAFAIRRNRVKTLSAIRASFLRVIAHLRYCCRQGLLA